MGDGEVLLMETPLQSVAQLRHAAVNLQQLVGELLATLGGIDQDVVLPFDFPPLSS